MSNKSVVETYIEGFRRTDHAMILGCLADDVEWVLHGYKTLRGKAAFDGEIENDAAEGSPTLVIDKLVEEDDTVVAVGHGTFTLKAAGPVDFVFSEVFTFVDGLVSRLETYHINLGGVGSLGETVV
ncbi:nuclear transport factor 2 family protein [Kutzneria kofuensis]|uniref:Ketosteroid isomerase-like protein n=1 Tax=Kutzneria kofuensis TaxID=103725 RepID=A0A7W9NLB3_9PSEU|nr:nuclear transport factor 2 family protein [Kutzneria kofuensis]MBB5897502.1 ketosteroid isomerase-like protein [Kutzneria kofuensis]